MPDKDKNEQKKRKDPLAEEGEYPTSQAEGDKPLGSRDNKVGRNPDTAEGDRETVEENIKNKQK